MSPQKVSKQKSLPWQQGSFDPSISADGQFVAFSSGAHNLVSGDTNGEVDIFVHDTLTGETERVNISTNEDQAQSPRHRGDSYDAEISGNGRFVVFTSAAFNLVEEDSNNQLDIFVHDRKMGVTERVSVSTRGDEEINPSQWPSISADGRYVTFSSSGWLLVDADTNGSDDVFVRDRETGVTERVSIRHNGKQTTRNSNFSTLSADGRFIVFSSRDYNLVKNDTNIRRDTFVAKNNLYNRNNDLSVTLTPTSGATMVNQKIRFVAKFTNNSDQDLNNCRAKIVKTPLNSKPEFSFYTWPLDTVNPQVNSAIKVAQGETRKINLLVTPLKAMRREVKFNYICDDALAAQIPFSNTAHLIAKTSSLTAEDFVRLTNGNGKKDLIIDQNNGRYWTAYILNLKNTGHRSATVNLTTNPSIPRYILRQPRLCEIIGGRSYKCSNPPEEQIQVTLNAQQSKSVWVFAHAKRTIVEDPEANRIIVEARDLTGKIVAKNSIGIYTVN